MRTRKKVVTDDKVVSRIKNTSDFLEDVNAEKLVVAGTVISTPSSIKYDGATEKGVTKTTDEIRTRVAACREAYENAGIIGNAIDLMVDFALEGFDIVHHNQAIQNFYQVWASRVNLEYVASQILKCYFRDGNVPVLSYNGKIKEREFNKLQKAIAEKTVGAKNIFIDPTEAKSRVIPYAYHILDFMNLEKCGSELLGTAKFYYRVGAEDLKIIQAPDDQADGDATDRLRKALGDGDYEYLKENGMIKIDPARFTMIYYKKDDYRTWATPMFWRIIDDIKYKKLLRDMDISVCESVMNTLTVIALGNTVEGLPPTPKTIEKFTQLLKVSAKSKTIVWNDLIKIIAEYPPIETILGKEKYEQVDADIRAGIGIAEVVLNGQGNNYANSFLSVKTLLERLEGGRNEVLTWLNNENAKVARAMGFKQPAWIKMHRPSLRDEDAEKKLILELVDRGMVSYETCVDRFGENFQIEMERMKREDDFRRKNEKKYPFVLTKVGKFGPTITNGPIPTFEALEVATPEDHLQRQGVQPPQPPTAQDGQGQKGGRPAGTKKPQQKKETPRNAPVGQKTAAAIYDKIYSSLEHALVKSRGVENSSELSRKDKLGIFSTIAGIIDKFDKPEDVTNRRINEAIMKKSQNGSTNGVMKTYSQLVGSYMAQYGSEPPFEDLKDIIVSSLALVIDENHK